MKSRNLNDLLPEIRKRPGMFISEASVIRLYDFINGYNSALITHELDEEDLFDHSLSFHDWVALRTHFYESTSGWANMLNDYCKDEEKAFYMFFEMLEEYRNRSIKTIMKKAELNHNRVWRSLTGGTDDPTPYCYVTPRFIEIVKYSEDPGVFIRYLDANNSEIDSQEYCPNLDTALFRLEGLNITEAEWKN